MAAKLCRSCGQPVLEGAKFCTECGTTLVVSSTEQDLKKSQSEKNDAPRGYCDICGVKLTLLNMTTRQLYNKEFQRCTRCAKREHKKVRTQQQATKSMASPENCVVCGVKLTLGNRNLRYWDKCAPCGARFRAMEPEKARAALAQQPHTKQESWPLTYLGGFSGFTSRYKEPVKMRFDATQVAIENSPILGDKRVLWVMPYNKITDARIDTTEHLTAARLLLTGILAFGLKKKDRYLVVSFVDQNGMVQNPVFDGFFLNNAMQSIYQRITQAKAQAPVPPVVQQPQQPPAATIDVAEQIEKLGKLRDKGLLTEQEFDLKKQELLARM